MAVYSVEKSFTWQGKVTPKAAEVMKMFGVDLGRVKNNAISHSCTLDIRQGDICYITGASGSGKSVLLRQLYKAVEGNDKINFDEISVSDEATVVDCIKGDFFQSLKILSVAGLSDVFCVLNRPSCLSDGQKYRFRLAKAIDSGKKIIFADEFCSSLDRITAAVIAYNVHKFAKRYNITFILAGCGDDILADLAPDIVVVKYLSGATKVVYRENRRQEND